MIKKQISNNVFLPMPVCIVGTVCDQKENYMAVGWITRVNGAPPMLAIGIGNQRLTRKGIAEHGEFSVNFPVVKDLAKTDYIGMISGHKEDKSQLYSASYGNLKHAPLIDECPLSLECQVVHKLEFPTHTLFVGEIIGAHADADYVEKNSFNYERAGAFLLTMTDNIYWSFGKKIGRAWADGMSFQSLPQHER